MSDYPSVTLGLSVLYYDEDRQPAAALVAFIHKKHLRGRPICNLATFNERARLAPRVHVEPAFHDGNKWHLVNKWAFQGEVPEDEWNYLPAKVSRGIGVASPTTQIEV